MASSARRPLTTYSRRHRPRKDPSDDGIRSSPIRPLQPDAEDVTFAEMASRMNKRARQVAKSASFETGDSELTSSSRPLKRRKPLQAGSDGDPGESDYMRDFIPASASGLCTPRLPVPSDYSMFPSSDIRPSGAPDRLSPLPPTSKARNKVIRTSSRNYKENAMRSSSRRLASPFNSRPGSRANSPVHRKRPGHHVKSRTLSHSAALGEKVQDRNIVHSPSRPGILDFNPFPASHETKLASPNGKAAPSAHSRSSSTPSVKPALDSVSFEPWLVPPKHFPRSPPPSAATPGLASDDKEKPAHLSFFLDAPMHISTPPQQQRAATTSAWAYGLMPQLDADPPPPVRTFHYDSDVDMSDSSLPGSPETNVGRPNYPRRRRRTIVHLPSDSLFSSCLDFSGVASETERLPRGPISEGSQSPAQDSLFHQLALEPAFSPTQSASNSLNKVRRGTSVSHGSSQSLDCPSAPGSSGIQVDPVSSVSSPGSGPPPSLARPDPGGDELLDLFSVMGLDEDDKWRTCMDERVHDSGVVFTTASQIDRGVVKTRISRTRSDTIRASDYLKQPASTVPSGSASAAGSASSARPNARRTRSGTVTQASTSAVSGKHKHSGWPTIKMRTNAEPLRMQGDDDDDELLLKDGDVFE